ncbi:VOC family protein [Salinarchaeum sp. IM2453]|uniref:VOC family protein n=1 Tax=Salinarchaeum sp. IM2453 TaxID=2862870 RepID=UPI001C82A418|nr:VOC family protein [Salinarchaeum sp. IM2453]QZA87888.1 VOC family protein [Salinarchaeum sp. IM2453]
MAILHFCLNVADAEQAATWYTEELGFERSWEFTTEDGDTRNVYVADENGVELQLSETDGVTPEQSGELFDHFAVHVENIDQAFEEINNHGVQKEPGDQPAAGARTAFILDPDGHPVELIEPLE